MVGIIVQILLFVSVECEKIHLEKISNLFVPASFTESGEPVYSLGSGSAEQLTYDPRDKIIYVVGRQLTVFLFFVVDFLHFGFFLSRWLSWFDINCNYMKTHAQNTSVFINHLYYRKQFHTGKCSEDINDICYAFRWH